MNTIIQQIDKEISTLQQVRTILSGQGNGETKPAHAELHIVPKRKHKMSPEGRARIAAAAKLRWKKKRAEAKAAAKEVAAKQAA